MVALASLACSTGEEPREKSVESAVVPDSGFSASPSDSVSIKTTVVFFGTSLTAGYGLDPSIAFPNLVAARAAEEGMPIVAVNAGLSGETSAGAVRRIEWTLKEPADVVIIETGGNDALRALDPDSLESNLKTLLTKTRAAQPSAKVLLAVMEAPPNLGSRYTARFRRAYVSAAAASGVDLLPFLLDGVAGHDSLNQADGVHPNAAGERIVADNVWKTLRPIIRSLSEDKGARTPEETRTNGNR